MVRGMGAEVEGAGGFAFLAIRFAGKEKSFLNIAKTLCRNSLIGGKKGGIDLRNHPAFTLKWFQELQIPVAFLGKRRPLH
jgi:hypothetical protein